MTDGERGAGGGTESAAANEEANKIVRHNTYLIKFTMVNLLISVNILESHK